MALWIVHTEESIHGAYEVEAESGDEARAKFEADPLHCGTQIIYELEYAPEVVNAVAAEVGTGRP